MSVYKDVVEDILYELRHKDEMIAKLHFDDERLFYVYMTGRMTPILEAIVRSEKIK